MTDGGSKIISHGLVHITSKEPEEHQQKERQQAAAAAAAAATAGVPQGGRDDLVALLELTLHLASELVNDGAWWQEARTQDPLLLMEILHVASTVCIRGQKLSLALCQ
jgi:hypothetical protein